MMYKSRSNHIQIARPVTQEEMDAQKAKEEQEKTSSKEEETSIQENSEENSDEKKKRPRPSTSPIKETTTPVVKESPDHKKNKT